MGCDYYIYENMRINYKDDDGDDRSEDIELSKQGRYFSSSYDSDSEDDYDRQLDKEIEFVMSSDKYKDKILFADGNWKITSQDKILYYKRLIDESINFTNILSIKKCYYALERL